MSAVKLKWDIPLSCFYLFFIVDVTFKHLLSLERRRSLSKHISRIQSVEKLLLL